MEGGLCAVSTASSPVSISADRSSGRLGQEPPPQQEETEYDPRSLYEVRRGIPPPR